MKKQILIATIFIILSAINLANGQSPAWEWAHSAGGLNDDQSSGIALDANGNSYVTGYFVSPTITFGSYTLTCSGSGDMFVVKYNSSGTVLWAKSAIGSEAETGYDIAVDANGNSYVVGAFNDDSLTFGNITLTNKSFFPYNDIFIVKYDAMGNVVWAKSEGDYYNEVGFHIATDPNGYFYVTGTFDSDSVTFGTNTLFNSGSISQSDMFFVKYDANGTVMWAESAGGSVANDSPQCITVDASGNCFATGFFSSPTITFGNTTLNNSGSYDMFIAKYYSNGGVAWAQVASGSNNNSGNSVAADAQGNCYVTGAYSNSNIIFGSIILPIIGGGDMFTVKYDSIGNVVWASALGSSSNIDAGKGITLDAAGNIYETGVFYGPTLTIGNITLINDTTNNTSDVFVVKYDSNGTVIWATSSSGNSYDYGIDLAVDANGKSYLTGIFYSSDINFGSTILTKVGNYDMFIAKLNGCASFFTMYPDTIPHNWIAVNQASGAQPLSYLWEWGDGNTSTGATPSHTYNVPGYYNICLTITDGTGCVSTYCDSSTYLYKGNNTNSIITVNVTTQIPTGIETLNTNENIANLYPNPATNNFTISLKDNNKKVNITITDIAGKRIYSATTNVQKIELNTKEFAAGVYVVKVDSNDFVETRKLMVAK